MRITPQPAGGLPCRSSPIVRTASTHRDFARPSSKKRSFARGAGACPPPPPPAPTRPQPPDPARTYYDVEEPRRFSPAVIAFGISGTLLAVSAFMLLIWA